MLSRRRPIDPETARLIEQRLEHLMLESAESRPRRVLAESEPVEPDRVSSAGLWLRIRELALSRAHLAVVAVLALLALLGAGWMVLRARPVAMATPLSSTAPAAPTAPTTPPRSASPPGAASSRASPGPVRVVVHVLGAVRRPGLVTLTDKSRVKDALDAAGGLRRNADPGRLNLAAPVADGQQIFVGTRGSPAGEVRDGAGAGGVGPSEPGDSGGAGALVDLNAATAVQLEALPGVGPVTASKIIGWRQEHGRFSRIEELQEVSGIGPKTYAEIAPHCRV